MDASASAHWSKSTRIVAYRDAREAARNIEETGCSKAGLEIMMGKGLPLAIRVDGVPLRSAILIKQEAISAGGDAAYSADVAALRCDSTDVVLLTSACSLPILVRKLERQPFGLKKLAASITSVAAGSVPPRNFVARGRSLPLGDRTYIMGILNATPDSFSDGGLYFSENDAIAHAEKMIAEGADMIDIGGESTRPGSEPVPAEEERRRVLGIVKHLVVNSDALVSVDTMKPEVAEACLEAGAHIINDVSGLSAGPRIAELCASAEAALVVMHMRGMPGDMMRYTEYDDTVRDVIKELAERMELAVAAGVPEEYLVADPGFGFSKTARQNVELLARLREVSNMGYALLVGLSRKSTIGRITGVEDAKARVPGSLAAMTVAIMNGADMVRVHDVAESVQAAKMADALRCQAAKLGF